MRHRKGLSSIVTINGVKWHWLHKGPPCDNGFTRVSLYDRIGMYPESVSVHGREKGYISGESWIKKRTKHHHRIMLAEPNMGMLMDCAYIRGDKRMGRYIKPANKYYLCPLSSKERDLMRQFAEDEKMCFIEDFAKPDGWEPETIRKHSPRTDYTMV